MQLVSRPPVHTVGLVVKSSAVIVQTDPTEVLESALRCSGISRKSVSEASLCLCSTKRLKEEKGLKSTHRIG